MDSIWLLEPSIKSYERFIDITLLWCYYKKKSIFACKTSKKIQNPKIDLIWL